MQDEGILRGEIYYVAIPYATGHEMEKDRPAIVVSCTKAEIAALDIGIMSALALGAYDLARPVEAAAEAHPIEQPFPLVQPDLELAIVQVERDTYKSMYESLLDRMTMERRAGA